MEEAAKAASTLMKGLHAAFSEHSSVQFVLALPFAESGSPQKKMSVFRVFAASFEDLALLNSFISNHPQYDALFYGKFPQPVPADFAGEYKAYTRFRIATRSSPQKRYNRMVKVAEQGTLWIDMTSKENGNRFRMYIDVISGEPSDTGVVNSYGLSNANNPLFVPAI
jgi:hypothetical protein